jgi:sporulation protein YlmC with PRC-barrel domain
MSELERPPHIGDTIYNLDGKVIGRVNAVSIDEERKTWRATITPAKGTEARYLLTDDE